MDQLPDHLSYFVLQQQPQSTSSTIALRHRPRGGGGARTRTLFASPHARLVCVEPQRAWSALRIAGWIYNNKRVGGRAGIQRPAVVP